MILNTIFFHLAGQPAAMQNAAVGLAAPQYDQAQTPENLDLDADYFTCQTKASLGFTDYGTHRTGRLNRHLLPLYVNAVSEKNNAQID